MIQLREGGPDGSIVAIGFCKMTIFAGAYHYGTDHSMGTPISRGLSEEGYGPLTTVL